MGVCRRIFKNYEPTELTICVTICCEPRAPPRFDHWNISKPGYPPKIISCSRGSTNHDENREKRLKRKVVKRRKKSEFSEKSGKSEKEFDNVEVQILSDQPLLHSDSATLISDDVETMMSSPEIVERRDIADEITVTDFDGKQLEAHDHHVSMTSLDSIAGLGGMMSMPEDSDDVGMAKGVRNSEDNDEKLKPEEEKREEEIIKQMESKKKFDLLLNCDVEIPTVPPVMNDVENPKKKVIVRRKKKSTTPETAPRYREFTETSINMYIEMNKQNIGEFIWDQQCTRIDALVAPIIELDRTTTPEIPVEIEIFD
ncbi:hypothetical protein GCK72_002470 [Caenorhabditis remanei]|uniref:Uncharacterized protein n=1 Tax=Caenorhabditis remanei TaxID=31234 RepID=A0A6A5HSH0_CAERE|nr:hypothetical protein GCK72_002470 [Caenorhabditis remanei]KAF1770649.1 hypothetical protein GCK72_002470 [Caenorhabditis remanei]